MKILFLDSTYDDLEWFHQYYSLVFPEGLESALKQFDSINELLVLNPLLGVLDEEGLRKFTIPKTPFSYYYRITNTHIEVLRVWDDRREGDI